MKPEDLLEDCLYPWDVKIEGEVVSVERRSPLCYVHRQLARQYVPSVAFFFSGYRAYRNAQLREAETLKQLVRIASREVEYCPECEWWRKYEIRIKR